MEDMGMKFTPVTDVSYAIQACLDLCRAMAATSEIHS